MAARQGKKVLFYFFIREKIKLRNKNTKEVFTGKLRYDLVVEVKNKRGIYEEAINPDKLEEKYYMLL